MTFSDFVIINDLHSCLELVPHNARNFIQPLVLEFESLLSNSCRQQGYPVVNHNQWMLSLTPLCHNSAAQLKIRGSSSSDPKMTRREDTAPIYIIDKLWRFNCPPGTSTVDVHRLGASEGEPVWLSSSPNQVDVAKRLHIIDDAVFTGSTLLLLKQRLAAGDASIRAWCAAGRIDAISRLALHGIEVTVHQEVARHADILHARDFLTFFPFAGRRLWGGPKDQLQPLNYALNYVFWRHGECLSLAQWPTSLRMFVHDFPAAFVQRLEQTLGRKSLISDLCELIPQAYIPLKHPSVTLDRYSMETTLNSILGELTFD